MSDLGNDVDTNAMASKDDWAAEQTTGFLLWNLGNIWQREQRRALEPYGITPVQFLLLSGLAAKSNDQETVSQIALARHCRTDPMMTSQVVRALIRLGYVERTRNRRDKRAFAVRLTAKGREISQRAEPDIRRVDARFFAPLAQDIPAFTDALQLLAGERPRRRVQATSRNA